MSKQQNTVTETSSNILKDFGIRFVIRFGMHILFITTVIFVGAFISILVEKGVLSIDREFVVAASGLSYVGFLLIFPSDFNRVSSLFGLIAALLCVFTGAWVLAIAFAGIVSSIIRIVSTLYWIVRYPRVINNNILWFAISSFGSLWALLLLVSLGANGYGINFFTATPFYYYVLLVFITCTGIVCCSKTMKLTEPGFTMSIFRWLAKIGSTNYNYNQQQKTLNQVNTPSSNPKNKIKKIDINDYKEIIDEISELKSFLPVDIMASVEIIETKANAILEYTHKNAEYTAVGKQFLEHHLPSIKEEIEDFIFLWAEKDKVDGFKNIKEQKAMDFATIASSFRLKHKKFLSGADSDNQDKNNTYLDSKIQIQIANINRLKKILPPKLMASVEMIEVKKDAILDCMKADSRDIAPGKHFLTRYIPIIEEAIKKFTFLYEQNGNSEEFELVQQEMTASLTNMENAFTEMHQRLLNNDISDLMAEINTMKKLSVLDGYELVKK